MNKFLAAVILGSILLVGVGYGSISLMQKTNAQQGQNMTGNATMTGGNVTGNATSNMTSGSGSSISIVPGSSAPANGKSFDPASTAVSAGTTVTWTNHDTTLHTVTSGSAESGPTAEFDSSYLNAGKTFQHKFDKAGTFDYYCTLHPFMKGEVVVS
jgi:plastocyanin